MSKVLAPRIAMPDDSRSTQGLLGSAGVDRKGPKRADSVQASVRRDADKSVATWFDAALKLYSKATAYAELIGVDINHLRRMRAGEKSIPLRDVLPFRGHTEPVLAFVKDMLDSIGYVAVPKRRITPEQVGGVATRVLMASPLTREMLERECEREYGATPEQVELAALHREEEKP